MVNSLPYSISDASEDNYSANNSIDLDREALIRHLFETNPVMGCKMLFKLYYTVLCNHAFRFLYCKQASEDIVGEVFCHFLEKKIFQQITTSYRAYLFATVRNYSLNQLKKEFSKKWVDIEDADSKISLSDPHQILQAVELNNLLEKTVLSLPSKCQIVFMMSRMEGKNNISIAEELGISVKAVEAHITKALARIRMVLSEEYSDR